MFSFQKGIMSLYALSLLTKRKFLINMNNPCDFDEIFLPNQVNWHPSQQTSSNGTRNFIECHNMAACAKKFNSLNASSLKTDILSLSVNHDWLSYFSNNKNMQAQVLSSGFNSSEKFKLVYVFKDWYNKLFKLSPTFEKKYELILQNASLASKTQIYCAQIRIGGKRPNVNYDKPINDLNSTKLFWSFIREKFIRNNTNWRLYVTSDMDSVELEAIKEFGRDKVILISGVNSHIDREDALGKDCSRIEKPILDFHFMQNCNMAVVSMSGFGILGIWNRKEPIKDAYMFYRNKFKPLTYETLPIG